MKRKIGLVLGLIGITVLFEIERLVNIPITWDEGLTYVVHCENYFHSNWFPGAIIWSFRHPTYAAGNNHLLNTLLIGAFDVATDLRFNALIIRLPVILFGTLYLFVCTKEFLNNRITWVGYCALLCCSYANEFFALARGYGLAASIVLVAAIFFKKWQEEGKWFHALITFFLLFLAELANTAVLLLVAAFMLFYVVEIVHEKNTCKGYCRLLIALGVYGFCQLLVVIHHFHIAKWDSALYADYDHGINKLIYDTLTLPAKDVVTSRILFVIIFSFLCVNMIALCTKVKSLKPYTFCTVLVTYFLICFIAVTIFALGGYPVGRVLVPSYPLVALGLDELVRGGRKFAKSRLARILLHTTEIMVTTFMFYLLFSTTDCTTSTDWPSAAKWKAVAYSAFANGITNSEFFQGMAFNTNDGDAVNNNHNDAVRYWRNKILFEEGHDIFGEEQKDTMNP